MDDFFFVDAPNKARSSSGQMPGVVRQRVFHVPISTVGVGGATTIIILCFRSIRSRTCVALQVTSPGVIG